MAYHHHRPYQGVLGTYLVKLSSKSLTIKDSNEISKILHAIGDIERIGDHAAYILGVAKEMDDKKLSFSDKAQEEIRYSFRCDKGNSYKDYEFL